MYKYFLLVKFYMCFLACSLNMYQESKPTFNYIRAGPGKLTAWFDHLKERDSFIKIFSSKTIDPR